MCPDDSNGIYNVPNGTLVNSGDTVLPSQHNPWANDSATAISNRFSKDGRAPATGNWNLNTFRITNLATPVANGDAATKQYVDGAVPNNVYSLVSSNTNVTASDKGKWYRTVTSGITFTPDSASTLGANNFFRIKNDSSGLVFVDPSGSETINGSATLLIPSGQEVFVISDGINLFATIYSSPQQGPQLQGYISGLTATINAVTPATNIDVAPGAAASSASPYYLMQLLSGLTKNTNLPWVVGTGQGSLDAGTIGDGRYYGFLIQRSDTGVVDVLTSLSHNAPTPPANYDRRSPPLFTFLRTGGVNGPVTFVNNAYAEYVASSSFTSSIPLDDTIPQSSEGTQILSLVIVPRTTTSKFRITSTIRGTTGTGAQAMLMSICASTQTDAIAAGYTNIDTANYVRVLPLDTEWTPGTTSPVTISTRVAPSLGATLYLNGNSGGRVLGGASKCTLTVEEVTA